MSKTILALDLGSTTGWAKSDVGSGIWELTPRRHESAGMRWINFENSLTSALQGVDLVVYEEVCAHKGNQAGQIYGGFVALLQHICDQRNINYQGIPVGTIKKFATGKGNANKTEMIKAAKAMLGREPVDDNEADAVCLLDYAKCNNNG